MKKCLLLSVTLLTLQAGAQLNTYAVVDSYLYKADVVNCTNTSLGITASGLNDIDVTTDGRLWGIGPSSTFYQIDTVDGDASLVGYIGGMSNALVGFDSHTLLTEIDGYLMSVDVAAYIADTIGSIGYGSTGDLAWYGKDLYMISGPDLVKIVLNPAATAITSVSVVNTESVPGFGFGLATLFFPGEGHFLVAFAGNDVYRYCMDDGTFDKICNNLFFSDVRGAAAKYVNTPLVPQCAAQTTGISEPDENSLQLFPNPVQNELIIQIPSDLQNTQVSIQNAMGQTIQQITTLPGQTTSVNTQALATGIYYVRLVSGNHMMVKKFVKQ